MQRKDEIFSPSKRKFHRYVYHFEVLSEEPLVETSLADLEYATSEGECSGRFLETDHEELDGPAAAQLLREQGSDPGFFELTDEGEDLESGPLG